MAHYSGSEGKVIITSAAGTPELEVTGWTLEKAATLAEITNSTTAKACKYKLVKKGGTCTLDIIWDSVKTPEDCSLDEGDELTADLRLGDSGKEYNNVPLIVERLSVTGCTQDGVVTYQVNANINGTVPDPATIA